MLTENGEIRETGVLGRKEIDMVKRCKLCGGEPKWVHYAIPQQDNTEGWKYIGENGELEPMVLFKRLECKECKATTFCPGMTLGEVEELWNNGKVIQYWMDETVSDVEPIKEDEVKASRNLQKLLDPNTWN